MLFETLYYPYITVDDYSFLKRMAVYSDKIYIMDPENDLAGFRKRGRTSKRNEQIRHFRDDTNILRENGIVQAVHPWSELESEDSSVKKTFCESIGQDLNDQTFLSLVNRKGVRTFSLALGKLVNLLDDLARIESAALYVQNVKHEVGGFVRVPAALGISLMTNYTIYLGHKHSVAPITDDRLFHTSFLHKIRRFKPLSQQPTLEEWHKAGMSINMLKQQIATRKVLEVGLPDFELKSFEDVIDLRHALSQDFLKLKESLNSIAQEVHSAPWDPDFLRELASQAREKVKEFRKETKRSRLQIVQDSLIIGGMVGLAIWKFNAPPIVSFLTGGAASLASGAIRMMRTYKEPPWIAILSSFSDSR